MWHQKVLGHFPGRPFQLNYYRSCPTDGGCCRVSPRQTRSPSTGLRTGFLFRQKDPKLFTPRSASLDWADAGKRAGQLARLRQGPPRIRASSHRAERQASRKPAESTLSHAEGLKQCAPFLRCRLHCSATPPGQGKLLKDGDFSLSGPTRY